MRKFLGIIFLFFAISANSYATIRDLKCYGVIGGSDNPKRIYILQFENETGKDIQSFKGKYEMYDDSGLKFFEFYYTTNASKKTYITAGETFYVIISQDFVKDSDKYYDYEGNEYVVWWDCKGIIFTADEFRRGIDQGIFKKGIPFKFKGNINTIYFTDGTHYSYNITFEGP